MRAGSLESALTAGVVVAILSVASVEISAHRLDEYLQAARIDVGADRVRIDLDLTPGAAVAGAIVTAIDRNGDGVVSGEEQRAYAGDVVRALDVRLDGQRLPLQLVTATFPEIPALRAGEGAIRLGVDASHPVVATGTHQLFFRNGHLAYPSVYLANALVPDTGGVAVTDQQRNGSQSELTIHYAVAVTPARIWSSWILAGVVAALSLVRFRRVDAARVG